MDNSKYSNICKDYENILKDECEDGKIKDDYCYRVSILLESCYKFKDMKITKEIKDSLKFDQSLK